MAGTARKERHSAVKTGYVFDSSAFAGAVLQYISFPQSFEKLKTTYTFCASLVELVLIRLFWTVLQAYIFRLNVMQL